MSTSLEVLEQSVTEVDHLLEADPTPPSGFSPAPAVTRAVIRSSVVILYSHFERYVRSVTEEAVRSVNRTPPSRERLDMILKLKHSRVGIEEVVKRSWDTRAEALAAFVEEDGWLWTDRPAGALQPTRLLSGMKSPHPKKLLRVYRLWGINDIFTRITRAKHTRHHFFLKLTELVAKRNDIAHGEFNVEATRKDVKTYLKTVRMFCRRADRALTRVLIAKLDVPDPWLDSN